MLMSLPVRPSGCGNRSALCPVLAAIKVEPVCSSELASDYNNQGSGTEFLHPVRKSSTGREKEKHDPQINGRFIPREQKLRLIQTFCFL
jgi:hypothetical protein